MMLAVACAARAHARCGVRDAIRCVSTCVGHGYPVLCVTQLESCVVPFQAWFHANCGVRLLMLMRSAAGTEVVNGGRLLALQAADASTPAHTFHASWLWHNRQELMLATGQRGQTEFPSSGCGVQTASLVDGGANVRVEWTHSDQDSTFSVDFLQQNAFVGVSGLVVPPRDSR